MSNFSTGDVGKFIIAAGVVLVVVGVLILVLGRFGLFRLPGDIEFGGRNWKIFVPIASCIILSLILTAILWVLSYFLRR